MREGEQCSGWGTHPLHCSPSLTASDAVVRSHGERLRVAASAYNIEDEHIADAIAELVQ
ncbi:MAG: hypothetical protein JOZ18_18075 [Chloroflexi bacterium]|nr:hypothetical protein [Chloroflexota bacterium]